MFYLEFKAVISKLYISKKHFVGVYIKAECIKYGVMCMAIRLVSSVSFRNNNISFESRHRRDHGEHSRHTNALRSIPVAALIAMSPMVNARDFSLEPNESQIENVYELNSVKQRAAIPMPKHWKVLKELTGNLPDDNKVQFRLIDTDGYDGNYEIFEYRRYDGDGSLKLRQMLVAVKFMETGDRKSVVLYGLGLNKKDVNDYAYRGETRDLISNNEEVYALFKDIVDMDSNNGAFIATKSFRFDEFRQKLDEYENKLKEK